MRPREAAGSVAVRPICGFAAVFVATASLPLLYGGDFPDRPGELLLAGHPPADSIASIAPPNPAGTIRTAEAAPSAAEITKWISQLDSDRYTTRDAAVARLSAAARDRQSCAGVYQAMKSGLADPTLPLNTRLTLASLVDEARYHWLVAAERKFELASAAQVDGWVAQVSKASRNAEAATRVRGAAAERELLDALLNSENVVHVKQSVEKALESDELDPVAATRLQNVREWTQPAIAAEYWKQRRNQSIQYVLLGKPTRLDGAYRASHFDELGRTSVRCISGNSLRPGVYPLDVAFPHPREHDAFFQLVSLPAARDRFVHQFETTRLNDAARLRAITERTMMPAIDRRRVFEDGELLVLPQLDPPTVARLLSDYFSHVPDEAYDLSDVLPMLTDESSRHRAACLMLAVDGSHELVPALVDAAKSGRMRELPTDQPHSIPWIAALSIARRDPWPEIDVWLESLIDRSEPITFGGDAQCELGATAAALLVARHGETVERFNLVAREPLRRDLHDRFESPVNDLYRRRMFEDRMFRQLGITPHRFSEPGGRAAVAQWHRSYLQTKPKSIAAPKSLIPANVTVRAGRP